MKSYLLIFLYMSIPLSIYCQEFKLNGRIIDEQKQAIVSATVRCLTKDSALVAGNVSNGEGMFSLSVPVSKESYWLFVSFVGYKEYVSQIQGNNSGTLQMGDIMLIPDTKQLGEVVVTGQQMKRTTDKLIYFPSKEQLRNASDGYNALAIMMIPTLDVDPFSKKVSTVRGNTTLLINGREASSEEVKNLNPKDILRVDFYDQHHPEYPLANSVIDYILIHRNGGGSVALNGEQHLNKGTGTYGGTGQFFKKKSEFAVFVSDAYNHYTPDRGTESTLHLGFPSGTIINEQKSLPSLQKSNRINSYFNYIYQDKQTQFYASAIFRQGNSDNDNRSMQTYSNEETRYQVRDFSNNQNVNPALKLSFNRVLKKNQTLRVTLRGSYNDNQYDRLYTALENNQTTNTYTTIAKENYYNVAPSLMYTKTDRWKNIFFLAGNGEYTHTNTDYRIDGTLSNDTQNMSFSLLTLGYAILMVKNLRMTLQWGNGLHTFNNGTFSYVKYIFRPGLFVNYQFNPKHSLRVSLMVGSGDLGPNFRSAVEQRIDKYQVRRGNPDIETTKSNSVELNYILDSKYINLTYLFDYSKNKKFPYESIKYDFFRGLFIHGYDPLGKAQVLMTGPRLRVKIIPQKLTLDVSGYYWWRKYDYWKTFTLNRFEGSAKLLFIHKNIMASAQVSTPQKSYENGYLVSMPVTYNLNVGYTLNNWHFELATRNPFSEVVRKADYVKDDYQNYTRSYGPRINDHVFYMTVSYRFNFGKKHKFNQIQMEDTGGSTILKVN